MKKLFFLVFFIFSLEVLAEVPAPCKEQEPVIIKENLDLDTKTLKSWIRLLKNRNKMDNYGVQLTKAEVNALIKCLTIELELRRSIGKMR